MIIQEQIKRLRQNMAKSVLNQLLLHEQSRVGADSVIWFEGWGGDGLYQALASVEQIIPIIEKAGLRGLGGSGFPCSKKMRMIAAQSATEKYLICNGNEDEPGTFKDRLLLQETPLQLIEGASIVALACNINHIYIYINPHLGEALEAVKEAIKQWLESDVYKQMCRQTGLAVNYSLVASSGHYIGGEETAVVESIEGKFPFPRIKPPLLMESGLHKRPTLVHNIETLCNVPHILRKGAEWFKQQGLGESSGTKLYSLSGDIVRAGVYELPMGTTLSELVYRYGQGGKQGAAIKAVFTGGASNVMLTRHELDVALDFDSLEKQGASLGTGAMIVLSEDSSVIEQLAEYMDFFASASCGQCPSCKSGTYFMSQLLNKLSNGRANHADLQALRDLCCILPDTGRCHLINGAVKIVDSSLQKFYHEYLSSIGIESVK